LTPEQHNKYLAISHLVYGGLSLVLAVVMLMFFAAIMDMASGARNGPPFFLFLFVWLFMGVIYGAMTVPSLIAGYGLLKRKKWAKTASIIAGVLAAMSFPVGTAVCVYTFWFLFSEPGKVLYDKAVYALPSGSQAWAAQVVTPQRENQYVPPQSPPDWR
jgi:hypothetical protein